MRCAFNLLVFPNSMFTPLFMRTGYVLSGEIAFKSNHYYYGVEMSVSGYRDRRFEPRPR